MNRIFYAVLIENGIVWSTSIPAPSMASARTRLQEIYPFARIHELTR